MTAASKRKPVSHKYWVRYSIIYSWYDVRFMPRALHTQQQSKDKCFCVLCMSKLWTWFSNVLWTTSACSSIGIQLKTDITSTSVRTNCVLTAVFTPMVHAHTLIDIYKSKQISLLLYKVLHNGGKTCASFSVYVKEKAIATIAEEGPISINTNAFTAMVLA